VLLVPLRLVLRRQVLLVPLRLVPLEYDIRKMKAHKKDTTYLHQRPARGLRLQVQQRHPLCLLTQGCC
jgi:hypothetical protein